MHRIKLHAATAAIFYVSDTFVWSVPLLSMLGGFMALLGAFQVVFCLFRDRSRIRDGVAVIVTYPVALLCVILTILLDSHFACERGNAIVQALGAYKVQHGDYPEDLNALVPEQLPEIPRARHTLVEPEFHYYYSKKHSGPFLWFMAFVPELNYFFSLEGQNGWVFGS